MEKPLFDWGEEFAAYLDSLNDRSRSRMTTTIKYVQDIGLSDAIQLQLVKKLDKNLYELRVRTKENNMRACYFQILANQYYITHGFNKKTQKTPPKEIRKAKQIRTFVLKRKADDDHE